VGEEGGGGERGMLKGLTRSTMWINSTRCYVLEIDVGYQLMKGFD
jgi:hypothetical protein